MTDREAIRMLAKAVLTLSRLVPHTSVEGFAKAVLEELPMPAAPTVTREQAEHARRVVRKYWDRYMCDPPEQSDWPSFFRAVADALEDKP